MYTLLVCADLYGEKMNLEVTFPQMPTIGDLQRKVVDTFSSEAQVKRPQGYPAIEFQIARLQVYDDVLLKWADLVTATQLHEYDQMYAFQPQSPWHIDVQKDLPPPRPPTAAASRAAPATPGAGMYDSPAAAAGSRGGAYAAPQDYSGHGAPMHTSAGGATPHHGLNASAPPGAAAASNPRQRSPAADRLDQNRSREEQLRAELQRIADENARLEQQAEAERAAERQRAAAHQDVELRKRESEIQRQRDALRAMEEEYAREQQRRGGGGGY